MIVRIGRDGGAALEDLDNFKAFKVVCDPLSDLHDPALAVVGRLEDGHFWVDQDWVRQRGRPEDADWAEGLGQMIAYAAKSGWISPTGAIRAHVEQER